MRDQKARMRRTVTLVATFAALLSAFRAAALEPTATVIEFYNASLNHYFITAFPEEAAMLDQGIVVPGWIRTGVQWQAWASATDNPSAVPVCRFYGSPIGPNSHFYTADPAECTFVKQDAAWRFEAIAFYIDVPQDGNCGADTTPVYRSFAPVLGPRALHRDANMRPCLSKVPPAWASSSTSNIPFASRIDARSETTVSMNHGVGAIREL